MKILLIILFCIIIIYFSYFIIIGLGLLKKKDRNKNISNKKHSFAILIPTRNEEDVIENLIDSINMQNYPNDLYKIYIVLNNSTDNTRKIVLNTNSSIIYADNVKNKGEALNYAFNYLKNECFDSYVIFDADNILDRDFLLNMNISLNNNESIVQGFRDTKNIYDNWISNSYAILYYIQNLFINKPRYNLNLSVFLNGTGFMVRKSIIDKYGYNIKTITEDIEYTILCSLNNERIYYNENAIFYDEQVVCLKTSFKQRKRWSFGTIKCLKYYFKHLIKNLFRFRNINIFDIIMYYILVFMQIIIFITSILFIILYNNFNIFYFIFIYIINIIFRIFLVKYFKKNIFKSIKGILLFDLFLLTWLPINIISLFIKKCSWDNIRHNRVVKLK